jgi:uncharacterized membrane protein
MKLSKKTKLYLPILVISILMGIGGYELGANFANPDFVMAFRKNLGIAEATNIHEPTLVAAGFLILIGIVQTILLVLACFSRKISQATGIEAQFGDSKTARKSLSYLTWMGSANCIFIALLVFAELWKPIGTQGVFLITSIALVCGLIMCVSGVRVWPLLDEMVRRIWVDATALSGGITLLLGMFWSLGTSISLVEQVTTFQMVLAYNLIYFVVYLGITAIRAPTTFTNPTLEDA